jgi:hypothetical protein
VNGHDASVLVEVVVEIRCRRFDIDSEITVGERSLNTVRKELSIFAGFVPALHGLLISASRHGLKLSVNEGNRQSNNR